MTNRALPGFFLDDDFSTNAAFSASMGFSANGSNASNPFAAILPGDFLIAVNEGVVRTWLNYDDPRFDPAAADALACPPIPPPPFPTPADMSTGCAIIDNGPRPGPTDPPSIWGREREVTDVDTFIRTLYQNGNASDRTETLPRRQTGDLTTAHVLHAALISKQHGKTMASPRNGTEAWPRRHSALDDHRKSVSRIGSRSWMKGPRGPTTTLTL